ncbi:hypothetical protein Glove_110g81 [Diversispora epigaea]|uniref:Uncharacterized protein n=1 Tax=Diversispora epigaea TaxID=1348612 RepID=A0A397J4C2_9GLOM|nr:hypothetical protein Glove_110g81 [Diversispora epigaea]
MEHLHSSSHKRPILDDSSETAPPLPDHQTKRMRLTLPPISATLNPSSSFPSFQLPIPPLEPNSGSLPILPPISATDSPVLPISSPRSLSGQQHHELPHIDSLGPLPPIPQNPHFLSSTPSKSMSISSILSNNEDDPFIKRLNMNIKEMDIGNGSNHQHLNNTLDYNNHHHLSHIVKSPLHHTSVDNFINLENIDKNVRENELNEINEDDQDDEFSLDRSLFEGLYLQREPHLIVKNDDSLNMEGREEHHLGHVIYDPNKILPPLEFHENGILEVWVSSKHLTWNNKKVRSRFLWGTDIYTDDSDVVAVLIHTGYFIPLISKWSSNPPNHDLCVTIRVLPKLVQYTATVRNQYQSRPWGNHHGVSYKIEKICEMKNGEAIGRSISKGRKERLRRFHQMRKRAFQGTEYDRGDESIIVFNNDGDPCLKYNLLLMSNDEHIKEKLRNEVLYLENDEERFEISYDETRDKYRFAIVSSATYLGLSAISKNNQESDDNRPNFPLDESHLEETIRDDLDFHEMSWNILGVIVEDKIDSSRSLLCILKRIFWRSRI